MSPVAWAIADPTRTRVWPSRSTSRPSTGVPIAATAADDALTRPAVANEPVRSCT
jgi:hypothetical protein